MAIYMIEVKTSRNSTFRYEIEDTTIANVMVRITKVVRKLDVIEIKIGEAI